MLLRCRAPIGGPTRRRCYNSEALARREGVQLLLGLYGPMDPLISINGPRLYPRTFVEADVIIKSTMANHVFMIVKL